LGSSKNYPSQYADLYAYFSGNSQTNPEFYDWNKVFIKYCDGTGH